MNDSLGHRTGDLVLNEVTQRLQGVIRAEDTLSRLGGDEFTIIMEGLKRGQDASLLAEKIIRTILNPLTVEGNELYVGSSIGISIYPDNGNSARELLRNADAAMYKAKHEGRNNFQYYSQEMTEQAFERLHMEGGLRTAMKNREFIIHYQPQIKGRNNQVMGVEALVRWQNSSLGLVPPLKFIPIAESTGLIIELDRHVMKQAMSQIVRWHQDEIALDRKPTQKHKDTI
ncbi:MAG: diguanylate cyclase [Candidatus Sedimenticola endophacoides]